MILVEAFPAGTDPGLLHAVLSEFFDRGVPVTVLFDAAVNRSGLPDDLTATMRDLAEGAGGLVELAARLGDLGGPHRYFQMRAAGRLRDILDTSLGAQTARQVVTVVDGSSDGGVDLPAFRCAGFRILLRTGDGGNFGAEFVGRGQLVLSGATVLPLAGDPARGLAAIDTILHNRHDALLSLSVSGLDFMNADAARAMAAAIADRLVAASQAGSLYVTRPMDYLLQFGTPQLTDVALLLASPEAGPQDLAVRAFTASLAEATLAFSLVATTRPSWLPQDAGRVDLWPNPAQPGFLPRGAHPLAVILTESLPYQDLPPVAVILHGESTSSAPSALRADGRLHIAVERWETFSTRARPPCESVALLIRPEDIATPVQRSAILRRLTDIARGGQARFLTLETLADQMLAPDPVHARLWSTLHRQETDPRQTAVLTANERNRLLDDARVAWSFIERFTDPTTGLCAGTVQDGPAQRINREATLWDIGSQMQGIVAAASLHLITRDDAQDRLARMVEHLPIITLEGHSLPPAVLDTGQSDGVVRHAFDICDTGRFLLSLDLAVDSGLLDPVTATTLAGSWDLQAAVIDGRPHNHDGRRWHDTTMSQCTPYIGPVFHYLGLPLVSPFPTLSEPATADERMALLYAVAAMGSFGTEPLLLQAIERGPTPESTFLTDVLFDAQLSWFEATGQLKCVSEIPLNVAPWFTYQGLRVDRYGPEAWTILSRDDASAFQTQAFRQDIELLSAKSAYLWAAVYPHPYSTRLLRLIRDKARIDGLGFSVGVHTATLLPMENYSDLNTNGVILAAIATMLRGDTGSSAQ